VGNNINSAISTIEVKELMEIDINIDDDGKKEIEGGV